MMNSQELETAVRLKLDLVVLVLVDNAFGMIRWKQAVDGFPDFAMTFGNETRECSSTNCEIGSGWNSDPLRRPAVLMRLCGSPEFPWLAFDPGA